MFISLFLDLIKKKKLTNVFIQQFGNLINACRLRQSAFLSSFSKEATIGATILSQESLLPSDTGRRK